MTNIRKFIQTEEENVNLFTVSFACLTMIAIENYSFLLFLSSYRTFTSIGLGNKFFMPRSDRQTFLAPDTLARGQGKKLHELYATRSHNTSSVRRADNSKAHLMSSLLVTNLLIIHL